MELEILIRAALFLLGVLVGWTMASVRITRVRQRDQRRDEFLRALNHEPPR